MIPLAPTHIRIGLTPSLGCAQPVGVSVTGHMPASSGWRNVRSFPIGLL